MKRLSILILAVTVTAYACKKSTPSTNNDNPTGPGPTATTTATTLVTPLKPSNEIPAVTGGEGNVSGSATIIIRATRNEASGPITSATADFSVNLSGFPAGSSVTLAHIHSGNNAVPSGGIIVNTGITSSDVTMSGGNASFTRNGVNVSADVAQNIISNPANFYFNVHSNANPGGVARGQVDGSGAPEPNDPNPKPEPVDPYLYLSKAHAH